MTHIALLLAVKFLEATFAIGAVGSVIVLTLSGIEDLYTLFGREKEKHS